MSEERKPIYGIGDKVRIINYGHLIWEGKPCSPIGKVIKETDKVYWTDLKPEYVGREDMICGVSMIQGVPSYSLKTSSWYDEGQLELINKNPNNE